MPPLTTRLDLFCAASQPTGWNMPDDPVLAACRKLGYLMAASTDSNVGNGLVRPHAYTVLDAQEVNIGGNCERLIKLRNPHGHGEWNGAWSDSSVQWSDEAKSALTYQPGGDDGVFWMNFGDFSSNFVSVMVNFTQPDVHTVADPGMGGNLYDVCCEPAVYCIGDSWMYWCGGQGYENLSLMCDLNKLMESETARWDAINTLHYPFADPQKPPAVPRLDGSVPICKWGSRVATYSAVQRHCEEVGRRQRVHPPPPPGPLRAASRGVATGPVTPVSRTHGPREFLLTGT